MAGIAASTGEIAVAAPEINIPPNQVGIEAFEWKGRDGRTHFKFRLFNCFEKPRGPIALKVGDSIRMDAREFGGPLLSGRVEHIKHAARPTILTVEGVSWPA